MISLPERYRGIPLMALASVLFAVMALFARMLAGRMPPHELVLIRFLTGLACMGAYYGWRGRLPDAPRMGPWVLRGLLGGGAVFFYFTAIAHLEVGPATALNYSSPLYAGVFASLFLGERLSAQVLAGILLASFGSVLVATSASGGHFALGLGAASGLLSALLGGAAMTVIRSLRKDTSPGSVFVSFCLFGALWALPFCVREWVAVDRTTLALAVGVGATAVGAQLLFTYAFKYVSAARGSAATQLTSVFTWMLGVLVLHESLRTQALSGAAICVGGVVISTLIPARIPAIRPPQPTS